MVVHIKAEIAAYGIREWLQDRVQKHDPRYSITALVEALSPWGFNRQICTDLVNGKKDGSIVRLPWLYLRLLETYFDEAAPILAPDSGLTRSALLFLDTSEVLEAIEELREWIKDTYEDEC